MDKFGQIWATIKNEVINLRREIHKWPEIAFEEYKTQEKIINHLKKYDVDYDCSQDRSDS